VQSLVQFTGHNAASDSNANCNTCWYKQIRISCLPINVQVTQTLYIVVSVKAQEYNPTIFCVLIL